MSYRTLFFTLTAAALCLLAATASTFAESMDSADFAYKYEASSALPTVEDSGIGKTNWASFLFTGSVSVADDLSVVLDDAQCGRRQLVRIERGCPRKRMARPSERGDVLYDRIQCQSHRKALARYQVCTFFSTTASTALG